MTYEEIAKQNKLLFEGVEKIDQLKDLNSALHIWPEKEVDLLTLRAEYKKRIAHNIDVMEL